MSLTWLDPRHCLWLLCPQVSSQGNLPKGCNPVLTFCEPSQTSLLVASKWFTYMSHRVKQKSPSHQMVCWLYFFFFLFLFGQLHTSWRRNLNWENASIRLAYRQICGTLSRLKEDDGGFSPLGEVLHLGKWFWGTEESKLSRHLRNQ